MLPSAQGAQAAAPAAEKLPAGHRRAAVRSAFGTDPASTATQCAEAFAVAIMPTVQGVQVAEPVVEEVPAGHGPAAGRSAFGKYPASTAAQ